MSRRVFHRKAQAAVNGAARLGRYPDVWRAVSRYGSALMPQGAKIRRNARTM
jgi:hypothetical protein